VVSAVTEAIAQQAIDDGPTVYAQARSALVAQVRRLPVEATQAPVPTCPGWSVKDVISHVAGLVADLLDGAQPPLGTDEMTARQVVERAHLDLTEVCDEWVANRAAFADFLAANARYGLGLAADLAVHAHDIAAAVDSVDQPSDEATRSACHRYVPLLQERVAERVDTALTVTVDDLVWEPTAGATALSLTTAPTDFLLGVTGRRTRRNVEQLNWNGDPRAVLDTAFTQYGPFQSVAG